ncbi:MAG: 6-phosphogluconate dehydrogenase, NADP(+)-dependent, decarboxylating [Chloroflexi bacterium ADurb.Bin325]|nr:MAG: 6-phosphogluconate dehydrogenase, NADP(+)-dependent, decarboxylating [Chloroflexi bacterium ADurb.Bin325]
MQADIGLIGLAVMGQNLVMNMADHGFTVAVFNRTTSVVDEFIAGPAKGMSIIGTHSLEELVANLKRPRRVMMLVKAGQPVDSFIEKLIPLLEPGDIIIDGGNSNYEDSIRRTAHVESHGLLYIGTGVSGGEEGARLGPSIMPGGSPAAWPAVKPIFQAVAAKVPEGDPNGEPCCDWVGENGAGHFVKMVHNGIEYGDMQLIGEAYQLMKEGLGLTNDEMSDVFAAWNRGKLESYLIEITRDILAFRDEQGQHVVDYILDSAGQKGTGKWTVISALDQGTPLTLVSEAVFARFLSSLVDERAAAAKALGGPAGQLAADRAAFLADLEEAVYASKIVSYAQGYMLMGAAAQAYGWKLNLGGIALMWRGGCIIRSVFLGKIKEAYEADPALPNLLLAPYFQEAVNAAGDAWRRVVAAAVAAGIPVPAIFDGYRRERLLANMTQAQRDYFGAHTYERTDRPRGQFFHTNWTGRGGDITARTYQA